MCRNIGIKFRSCLPRPEEMCVCVWHLNVGGCIWIGRGGREGGGGREHEISRQENEARVGWVIRQIQIGFIV